MAIWNPWHGCKKISPGCQHCYVYRRDAEFGKDSSIVTKTNSFDLPIKKTRQKEYKLMPEDNPIYTCMTSDFFIKEADDWRPEIWKMIRLRSDLHFVIITKRIDRFEACIPDDWGDGYENVTICCTCENQSKANYRLPIFLRILAKHKEIIHEPMLEEIHIEKFLASGQIEQVTCGGESGDDARLMDYAWALSTKNQCVEADLAFYFKQTGALFRKGNRIYHIARKDQMSQARRAGIDYLPENKTRVVFLQSPEGEQLSFDMKEMEDTVGAFVMREEKIAFEKFLYGNPARDYIFQNIPYEKQIRKAAEMIREADYVLLGVGAGMSTAAGAIYGGTWFYENFGEFQEKYGNGPYMQDMYSAGFYPYPDEESFWGYWSKQALIGGVNLDVTPLHRTLLGMLADKKIFCLSTNADGQFFKAGLQKEKIFCTQGDYFHIQCQKACHSKTYEATEIFRQMDAHRKDCKIPSYMVPKCPVCGGRMTMNLRCDQYFVQDAAWYEAEKKFGEFLSTAIASEQKICLLELGVGFNTPTIIRFPFEQLVREYQQISLIRLNLNEAVVPESFGERAIGINADMKQSIEDIKKTIGILKLSKAVLPPC